MSNAKAIQSSMARSGSGSRTSRGVSSCNAAVRTPTFMNLGWNGTMLISVINLGPGAAGLRALQDGLDDAVGAIAVFERGERGRVRGRRRRAIRDEPVDVPHQVAEGVRPRLLVPAGQVGVAADVGVDERRILLQDLVGPVAVADPQLVLLFLFPLQRRLGPADLDLQVVLVAGADLADRERSFRAVV